MRQDTLFSTNKTLRCGGKVHALTTPLIMGIINVTPDSFSDGGEVVDSESLLEKAGKMVADGAAILDIGGYSTRPGARDISPEEELDRVIPAITTLRAQFPHIMISIDTFRARIAEKAIHAGADMINDVSGGNLDEKMFESVAALQVPYILMHMRGTPQDMQKHTQYDNLLADIVADLQRKISRLNALGVHEIIVDPGFGFAKSREQNYYLLKNMSYLKALGLPLLVGISRKSMIFRTLGIEPGEAVNGSTVLNAYAILNGASILRVHDVREAAECIKLLDILKNAEPI